jgi:nuclear pore complex protein Nup62
MLSGQFRTRAFIADWPTYSYGLASNLNSQLDDLALSLTSMIDLVNGLSANNSATDASMAQPFGGNGNDPIGQIEAILNAHLGSLQWIDGAVKELEEKIRDAETKNAQRQQRHGGYEGTGSPTSSVYGGDGGARRGFGLGPVRR